MLEKVKTALLITQDVFDEELNDVIKSAFIDLNIAGVEGVTVSEESLDGAVIRAVVSYCGYHFELMHGSIDRSNAFKKAYDEQKAQLGMADGYTVWTTT